MKTLLGRVRSLNRSGRILVAIAVNVGLMAMIGHAFWRVDWQYSLPTPRPEGLIQPPLGAQPELPADILAVRRAGRPLLINFANPQCPCTEFNLEHVRALQKRFGSKIDFVTVLESSADQAGAQREFGSMHLRMPMVLDLKREVSTRLGVYGTPQAAILDGTGRLYFRGNYNRSRYCADEASEYVRIGLTALAEGRALPALPADATIPYGCPLPRRSLSQTAREDRRQL